MSIGPNASSTQIWKPLPFEMKKEATSAASSATNTDLANAADSSSPLLSNLRAARIAAASELRMIARKRPRPIRPTSTRICRYTLCTTCGRSAMKFTNVSTPGPLT